MLNNITNINHFTNWVGGVLSVIDIPITDSGWTYLQPITDSGWTYLQPITDSGWTYLQPITDSGWTYLQPMSDGGWTHHFQGCYLWR